MPTTASWYIEGYVIYMKSSGTVTTPELISVNSAITALLNEETTAARVHMIVDDTDLKGHDVGIREVMEQITIMNHPKLGWTVQFGYTNSAMKFIATVVAQFSKVRYRRAETFEDALALLKSVDSMLQDKMAG